MRLDLVGLGVSYGEVRALEDITLSFGSGEIAGLVGPNGAGKSTLLAASSGFMKPSRGQILVDGQPRTGSSPHVLAADGLRRSFQTSRLLPGETVLANVLLGTHLASSVGVLDDLFVTRRSRMHEAAARQRADEALELVGLRDARASLADDLSYGQQRLVEIARGLAGKPELLFLDEPAAGLNSAEAETLGETLRDVVRARGCGVVLVEHNLGLVRQVTDTLHVLNYGRLIASGAPDAVIQDPDVVEAYTGG